LPPLLTNSQHSQVMVGMDCNLHHPLWNPPDYLDVHCKSDHLISMMADAGFDLQSEPHIPTFYPPNPNHSNTMVDLMCTT
ncbi:hypothetical protein CROQUDRAFT_10183, partial [Cronartium quercuum f. sp. fusiforme G11]